jgi:serine/threonine protein kinase
LGVDTTDAQKEFDKKYAELEERDKAMSLEFYPKGSSLVPREELIPSPFEDEGTEVVIPGNEVGRGSTAGIFDAEFASGRSVGYPIVLKYSGLTIRNPYHPLFTDSFMFEAMRDTGLTLRFLYLSTPRMEEVPGRPEVIDQIRFAIIEKGGMSLQSYVDDVLGGSIPLQLLLKIAKRILQMLHILHSRGYVHGDPALRNIIFASPTGNDPLKDRLVFIDFEHGGPIANTRSGDIDWYEVYRWICHNNAWVDRVLNGRLYDDGRIARANQIESDLFLKHFRGSRKSFDDLRMSLIRFNKIRRDEIPHSADISMDLVSALDDAIGML